MTDKEKLISMLKNQASGNWEKEKYTIEYEEYIMVRFNEIVFCFDKETEQFLFSSNYKW